MVCLMTLLVLEEELGIYGSMALKMGGREIVWKGIDCIYRVQDRDEVQAVVSVAMNCSFHTIWQFLD